MTHLIGDIGNTETKLCILNKSFKIVRRLKIDTLKINNQYYFKKIIFPFVQNKIINKKALFSSVVPSVFLVMKKNLKKYFNIQCQELKQTYYSKIIKIKANKKQVGSDASHAWFSVYSPGEGWFEFDPTNDNVPAEQHITTAWGRDYSDVTPLSGVIFEGGDSQVLSVSVDVQRLQE